MIVNGHYIEEAWVQPLCIEIDMQAGAGLVYYRLYEPIEDEFK